MMLFDFDLQRFGGKGGSTTNVQTYEPTEFELQLQKAQADYANAVAPNALWLNDAARGLLQNSMGTVQVDYNTLNRQAQDRINDAVNGLNGIVDNTNAKLGYYDNEIGNMRNRYIPLANEYGSKLQGIADSNTEVARIGDRLLEGIGDDYRTTTDATNKALQGISDKYPTAANATNRELQGYSSRYGTVADTGNRKIDPLAGQGINAANNANNELGSLSAKTNDNVDKYEDIRRQLINGNIPAPYIDNMSKAIQSTLSRTMGSTVNSLANRGVINSSVSQGALNDISRNAADAVAQNYLNNISTIGGLLDNGNNAQLNLLGTQAGIANSKYGNTADALGRALNVYNTETANSNNALDRQSSLAQQQLGNTNNALGQQAGLAAQQQNFTNTALGQQGNLTQQRVGNALQANQNNANLYGQGYQFAKDAIDSNANLINQQFQNTLGAYAQNAGIYNGLLNNASTNITTAAAAQEAAQQPAINLWNASLGLNGASTGALAAASGQGKTTATTSKSGGGLFSGLLGGLF